MADATITKRLIVSGLTPTITVDDINRRLSSFGSVKAMDGFGLKDSLGQPRKFGYVTIETTPSRLGKCMNVLNGSIWKGTKLRLGEAKPDFEERIARENQEVIEERPKKRRRSDAVHAADMSLVTSENVVQRPGWKYSPSGRITHPLKIRSVRPLALEQDKITRLNSIQKNSLIRKGLDKKKTKTRNIQAGERTIDMIEWGSTHLKGKFLDSVSLPVSNNSIDDVEVNGYSSGEDAVSSNTVDDEITAIPEKELPRNVTSQGQSDFCFPTQQNMLDMEREKVQTLNFISSLFGGDEDDWIGRESVGSDVEMGELAEKDSSLTGDEPAVEEVPETAGNDSSNRRTVTHEVGPTKSPSGSQPAVVDLLANETPALVTTTTKLKDLFAPREEVAFSLLDHLDLDIALTEDLSFLDEPMLVVPREPSKHLQVQPTPPTSHAQSSHPVVLDPKQPLFFPFLPSESKDLNRAHPRDAYDVIRENGWHWRDPTIRFWNTESEEEIKKKWEASRGDLTKSWKQRWREAGKVRRRKKLVDGNEV